MTTEFDRLAQPRYLGYCRRAQCWLMILAAVILAACNAQPTAVLVPTSPSSAVPTQTPQTSSPTSGPSQGSPLVGTWERVNSCKGFVQAFTTAGLIDLAPEWLVGAGYYASADQIDKNDMCKGATEVKHSHFFTASGGFGSYDQNGQQVDDGSYKLVDDHNIAFPSGITVQYSVVGDTVTFERVESNLCTVDCRENTAWALSAFYPGPFQRVK
jgi:hypothetical protein